MPRRLPATPSASNAATRRAMQGNRRADTLPEIALRRALHARGLRFRKDYLVRVQGVRSKADVVFTRKRVAVFIDGCFWHGCAEHCRVPTRNRPYWEAKIDRNRDRDRRVTAAFSDAGWTVIRVWEHDSVEDAADRVSEALSAA